MTKNLTLLIIGIIFITFSILSLRYLSREYRLRGKLNRFGALVHVMIFVVHGIFYFITLIEEEHLMRTYGQPYQDYCAQVPRFIGWLKTQNEIQED